MFAAYLKIVIRPITDLYGDKAKKIALPIDKINIATLQAAGISDDIAAVICHLADYDIADLTAATFVIDQEQIDLAIVAGKSI